MESPHQWWSKSYKSCTFQEFLSTAVESASYFFAKCIDRLGILHNFEHLDSCSEDGWEKYAWYGRLLKKKQCFVELTFVLEMMAYLPLSVMNRIQNELAPSICIPLSLYPEIFVHSNSTLNWVLRHLPFHLKKAFLSFWNPLSGCNLSNSDLVSSSLSDELSLPWGLCQKQTNRGAFKMYPS